MVKLLRRRKIIILIKRRNAIIYIPLIFIFLSFYHFNKKIKLQNYDVNDYSKYSDENEFNDVDEVILEIEQNEDNNFNGNDFVIEKYENNNNNKLNLHYYGNGNGNRNENHLKMLENEIDYNYRYKGEDLEPEWEWVKNISIVYTWVDGSDINYIDLKSKYNSGYRNVTSYERSADELRYSLRSLEKYLPWHHGTIYIVTTQQIPLWLNIEHPRIKMIYHNEIIPEHIYPTFDFNTIELFLDKIPGITERFIYFKDNLFLNNYIHPSFFFTSHNFYPKIYQRNIPDLSQEKIEKIIVENKNDEINEATKYFTRQLIREYFDPEFQYHDLFYMCHTFYRDLFEPFRQLFKKELLNNITDRLRNPYKYQIIYLYQTFLQYASQHKEFPQKFGGQGKVQKFNYNLNDDANSKNKDNKINNSEITITQGKILIPNRTIEKYSYKIIPAIIGDTFIRYGGITNNMKINQKYFDVNQWKWISEDLAFIYIIDNTEDQTSEIKGLKYSLRSINKYLKWFKGYVYIITMAEEKDEFSWLNKENTKIKIIYQNDIIPEKAYHSHNKHIIEMYLDKIPGLSERFIYLQPHHYFINNVHPQFFFNEEFYPKYNFEQPLSEKKLKYIKTKDKSFYYTYSIIMDYFSKTYINSYRYLKDAPCPLYRDLFEPSRQLYDEYVQETLNHKYPNISDFLPLYMVATYNVYGTDQPYYPEFVTGFGKIRQAKLPQLRRENKSINYYGYDITSPIISYYTIMNNIKFGKYNVRNRKIIQKIKNSSHLFVSLDLNHINNLKSNVINKIFILISSLYNEKSWFEK
ncbi:hypothetical protein BCR32DRAFT_273301 [Anaeromyces robustus]|uniref:Stealth protein CR2 conserved region 2 domain-containing protein n=1 Tax=Anaeromyces robustus TaxID=1754192 RepID=A0A1Y1VRG0_9FUNG|nr:hypothetical protein BCR32DRAFT_273301 [Anaeromyces robustus]|eukprot:ORX63870.1 hypothetical protein BCR32DRAFT_273301 [Anaeromyces robustus]